MESNPADEIIKGIWIGNMASSQDSEFLIGKGIRAVFNCTKTIPFHEAVRNQYRVPVDDNLQEDEIRNMELWSFEIIYKLRLEHKKGPVLVHCHAGMQRSACVVAMYLIATANMKVEQAITYIQSKRPITFRPSPNFLRAIQGFERSFDKEIRPKLPLST
jgi:rhodanese-related sulfurtransferase